MPSKDHVRQRSEKMARDILEREGITDKEAQREAAWREGGWRAFLYSRSKGPMMRAVDVAKEDGLICQLTIDHVQPGGPDDLGNWALLCNSCNTYKGSGRSIEETRELMQKKGWAYERPSNFRDVLERIGASRSRA